MRQIKLYTDGSYTKTELLTEQFLSKESYLIYKDKIGTPGAVVHGGFVALDKDDNPLAFVRCNTALTAFVKSWANGGETLAAFMAVKWAYQYLTMIESQYGKEETEIIIYHDYIGISEWVKPKSGKKWKVNAPGAWHYVNMCNKVFGNSQWGLKYVKVTAHTGDKWNEVADALAKGTSNPNITREIEVVNV